MSRELRARARARIQPDTDDESDESEDADGPAQIPSTSIQDLINPADAQQFDQTFSDADAALDIEGAFDPTAGAKQVIPRIAFVLNFNLVYNEAQERWEPDTGNEGGVSGASARAAHSPTTPQSVPADTTVTVDLTSAQFEQGVTVDTASNQLEIQESGVYLLSAGITYLNVTAEGPVNTIITADSTSQSVGEVFVDTSRVSGTSPQCTTAGLVDLSAGDTVQLEAFHRTGGSRDLVNAGKQTRISAARVD